MSALLDVILPVFLIIGFGWAAARGGLITEAGVDGIMRFSQNFALPCLLFRNMAGLDLRTAFDPGLMISFYAGAFAGFAAGYYGARLLFNRPVTDSIAIGFACLFSNSLLLGLAITERAYGPEALAGNYAIIALHSPFLYGTGITIMELARSRGLGLGPSAMMRQTLRAIFTQPLVVGISLGFLVNVSGLPLPVIATSALDMMGRAAIPAALFGLGGVLFRYRPEGDSRTILWICFCSLVLHPAVTFGLGRFVFDLPVPGLRSATVTAAMPPGVNAYLFSHMYGVAKRVTASSVLVATALALVTAAVWLHLLP